MEKLISAFISLICRGFSKPFDSINFWHVRWSHRLNHMAKFHIDRLSVFYSGCLKCFHRKAKSSIALALALLRFHVTWAACIGGKCPHSAVIEWTLCQEVQCTFNSKLWRIRHLKPSDIHHQNRYSAKIAVDHASAIPHRLLLKRLSSISTCRPCIIN